MTFQQLEDYRNKNNTSSVPCGYNTGMRNDYISGNAADVRNAKCVTYTTEPNQVETEAHYKWRLSKPEDANTAGFGPFATGIIMIVVGSITALSWLISMRVGLKSDTPWTRNVIIGFVIAAIIALCLIIGGVFVMQYGQDLRDANTDNIIAAMNTWQSQEPDEWEAHTR